MVVVITVVRQGITQTNAKILTSLEAVLVEVEEEAEVEVEVVVVVAEVEAKPRYMPTSLMLHRCQPPLPAYR